MSNSHLSHHGESPSASSSILDVSDVIPHNISMESQSTTSDAPTLEKLKIFLTSATSSSNPNQITQFKLCDGEFVTCVFWNSKFFITGTDIVRILLFRFQEFGRTVKHLKKFEEGVFSDLRNLKPGIDAVLEQPRSQLLELLYRNNCIRTQKKQKVFLWNSVNHNKLFMDALERDLKREALGISPTTIKSNGSPMEIGPTLALAKQKCLALANQNPSSICKQIQQVNIHDDSNSSDSILNHSSAEMHTEAHFSSLKSSNSDSRTSYMLRPRKLSNISLNDSDESSETESHKNEKHSKLDEITKYFYCEKDTCTKKFKRADHLRRHMRSHIKELPYKCNVEGCKKEFSRADILVQHIKDHDNPKVANFDLVALNFSPPSATTSNYHISATTSSGFPQSTLSMVSWPLTHSLPCSPAISHMNMHISHPGSPAMSHISLQSIDPRSLASSPPNAVPQIVMLPQNQPFLHCAPIQPVYREPRQYQPQYYQEHALEFQQQNIQNIHCTSSSMPHIYTNNLSMHEAITEDSTNGQISLDKIETSMFSFDFNTTPSAILRFPETPTIPSVFASESMMDFFPVSPNTQFGVHSF